MYVIFVSSRGRGRQGGDRQQVRPGDTINITVPCDLVMGLLSQGDIQQMQIWPVPLNQNWQGQSPDQILAGSPGQPDQLGQLADTLIWKMKGQYPHSQIGLP